ncbi:MAG TPA: DUF4127 family protein [Pyrinomonadaceae bacterium]|jgi:hypothetical protein
MNLNKYQFIKQFVGLFLAVFLLSTAIFAQAQPKYGARILLIPLDDRPPCLQFPVRLGTVGDIEVIAPPREMLGKFTTPGEPEKIMAWLGQQDLKQFDALVVSLDMLAYGGLVAMREYGNVTRETAQKRIDFIRELKKKAPRLPIYGSSVIMRLAPTGNVVNESYRVKLARWAEISPVKDEKLQTEARKLEKEIPVEALANYKLARERDLAGNLQAIELAKNGVFDYLIVSQDDAHPTGVHVAERERLIAEINRLGLSEKIPVQPGADEVSMLLMARFVSSKDKYAPRVKAVYSSEATRTAVMPFEDRKLFETVSYHIRAVGGREVADEKQADLLFYVFASRFEPGGAETFAAEIEEKIKQGKRIILVDVDPSAKTEGAEPKFMDEIKRRGLILKFSGFATWNTAGNMIGTALPQAVLYESTRRRSNLNSKVKSRVSEEQNWFLFHRWLDDYIYNAVVRPEIRKFAAERKWNQLRFTEAQTDEVEKFGFAEMRKHYVADKAVIFADSNCRPSDDFSFYLPWNRAFEADIDFKLNCK